MRTHVALLRGINVGGKNKVAMADLRAVVADLGHTDVTTYVQSGNVVFAAGGSRTTEDLADELEAAIASQLGVGAAVVVLTRSSLDEVIAANPFSHESNPKAVHAVFLPTPPDAGHRDAVGAAQERSSAKGSPDQVVIADRCLYLWTPGGLGRSVLAGELNRKGNPAGTARNWATVTALAGLFEA